MIDKVLVATDFSETSEGALRWGLEVARAHDAEVLLVHAVRLPSIATPYVPVPPDIDVELQEKAVQRLSKLQADLGKEGFTVATDLRHDEPAAAIREAVVESGADLVVIGTRGQSALEHLLLGSIAERIVSATPCPVLCVHPDDYDRHRPLRRILVPTDFSEEARRSAELALDLIGGRDQGELILVHAYFVPVEYSAYGSMPTSWDFLGEVAKASKAELDKWAEELAAGGWKVTTEVEEGSPAGVIARLAKERDVDLVAMGTHGRGGFRSLVLGSVAKRVIHHAPCPVLTVRREEKG